LAARETGKTGTPLSRVVNEDSSQQVRSTVEESSLSQDTRSARARRTFDRIMTGSRNPARDRGTRVTGELDQPSPASASNHRSQVSRAERNDLHGACFWDDEPVRCS
jgi:hypothetical protein